MKLSAVFTLLGAVLVLPTVAQDNPVEKKKNSNLNQEIITVGERDLKLKDAFKNTFYPQEIDTVITKDDLKYDVLPVFFKTNFEPDTIKAARLKVVEPLTRLYPGYVKLGLGTYTSPLAEVYYGSKRERNGLYAVKFRHQSSKGNVKERNEFAGPFSDNALDLWGKKLFKKTSLGARLYASRNLRTLNGILYAGPASVTEEDVNSDRIFTNAGVKIDFQSYFKDEDKINHHEEIGVRFKGDNLSAQEINIDVATHLEKYQNTELYMLDFGVNQNLYQLKDSSFTQNNTLINLVPQIATRTGKLQFDVGLNITTLVDDGKNYFFFFPVAKISYTGLNRFAVPYAGLNGNAYLNTYDRLMTINPFFANITDIQLQREKLNVFVGLRGSLSERSSYNFKAGYHQRINAPLYTMIDDTTSTFALFDLSYVNYNYYHILAEYSLEIGAKFEAGLKANYFGYDNDSLGLNLPEFLIAAELKYNVNDKFLASISVTSVPTRLNAIAQNEGLLDLGGYTDLSVGLEYRYTRRFSIFLDGSNLLGNYLTYPNYATLGTFVTGGLTYTF